MGSRDSKSSSTTQYSGSWQAPPTTPEIQKLEAWQPDQALLDSGIMSSFDQAQRNLNESTGGYSGVNNPYAQARMREIGSNEIAGLKSSALSDANRQRNLLQLGQEEAAARLTAPQYITTGATTNSTQGAPSLLGSIISGGLSVAAAF